MKDHEQNHDVKEFTLTRTFKSPETKRKETFTLKLSSTLKKIRKENRLTIRDLASVSGISPGYLSQLENGKVPPPSREIIERLEKAFGLLPGILLEIASDEPVRPTELVEIYPAIASVLCFVRALMDEKELASTLNLVEKRIHLFQEDKVMLAENVKKYILGELDLNEYPGNKTRPLSHYIQPWGKEIEEWIPPDSEDE